MPLFDALTITFGTAGTGGFAIKNTSIIPYTEVSTGGSNYFYVLIWCEL